VTFVADNDSCLGRAILACLGQAQSYKSPLLGSRIFCHPVKGRPVLRSTVNESALVAASGLSFLERPIDPIATPRTLLLIQATIPLRFVIINFTQHFTYSISSELSRRFEKYNNIVSPVSLTGGF
jgi:hypothetical protein